MVASKTCKSAMLALITLLVTFSSVSHIAGVRAEDAVPPADGEQPTGSDDNMDTVTEAPSDKGPKESDDADVTFLFTRPIVEKPYEFAIGKEVHFLVGFKNKGQKDFQLSTIDASFRYSLDFTYTLQNFTSYPYNRVVEPNQETTLGYTFFISEQYAPRAYGFTVNLLYSDKDGVQYQNTVFNETVSLIELDEGLDSETFFLYIFLAAFVALIFYGLNKLYIKYVNPTRRATVKPVEQEKTVNSKEVDFDWLPPSMVANIRKTSTGSKKMAPAN